MFEGPSSYFTNIQFHMLILNFRLLQTKTVQQNKLRFKWFLLALQKKRLIFVTNETQNNPGFILYPEEHN